eukprot:6859735-Ditylum_brightwellii.AAC.1
MSDKKRCSNEEAAGHNIYTDRIISKGNICGVEVTLECIDHDDSLMLLGTRSQTTSTFAWEDEQLGRLCISIDANRNIICVNQQKFVALEQLQQQLLHHILLFPIIILLAILCSTKER